MPVIFQYDARPGIQANVYGIEIVLREYVCLSTDIRVVENWTLNYLKFWKKRMMALQTHRCALFFSSFFEGFIICNWKSILRANKLEMSLSYFILHKLFFFKKFNWKKIDFRELFSIWFLILMRISFSYVFPCVSECDIEKYIQYVNCDIFTEWNVLCCLCLYVCTCIIFILLLLLVFSIKTSCVTASKKQHKQTKKKSFKISDGKGLLVFVNLVSVFY